MLVHVPRVFGINETLLSFVGLWPFRNKRIRYLLVTTHITLILSFGPFQGLMLVGNWDDKDIVFECGLHFLVVFIFVTKAFCVLWYEKMFRRLYGAMENHWNVFASEIEVQILKHYSHISRKLTLSYIMILYFIMCVFLITPLIPFFLDIIWPLEGRWSRINVVKISKELDKDEYFLPIYFYVSAFLASGLTILISTDSQLVICTVHACSLFSIINQHLKNINPNKSFDIMKERVREYESNMNVKCELLDEHVIYQKYITCLKKYQLALQYVDILNSAFRTSSLIVLLISVALLSLLGIRIIYLLDQLEEFIRFVLVFGAMVFQLALLCYSGQKLIDESENVFHYAYAAEWYNFSPKIKSLLIITLQKSFTPCTLTAGNIITLSLTTYSAVMRASMSYFMTFLSISGQ